MSNLHELIPAETTGEAYKQMVNASGYQVKEMAELLGITRTTLQIRFNKEKVPLENFYALALVLNHASAQEERKSRVSVTSEPNLKLIKRENATLAHSKVVAAWRAQFGGESNPIHAVESGSAQYYGFSKISETARFLITHSYESDALEAHLYTSWNSEPFFVHSFLPEKTVTSEAQLRAFFESIASNPLPTLVDECMDSLLKAKIQSDDEALALVTHAMIKDAIPASRVRSAVTNLRSPSVPDFRKKLRFSLMRVAHSISNAIGLQLNAYLPEQVRCHLLFREVLQELQGTSDRKSILSLTTEP